MQDTCAHMGNRMGKGKRRKIEGKRGVCFGSNERKHSEKKGAVCGRRL